MRLKIIALCTLFLSIANVEQTSYAIPAEPAKNTPEITEAKEPLDAIDKKAPEVLFFTTYNAGAVEQNDGAPCHSASGKDICQGLRNGESHVAITKDIRKKLNLRWGDKVKLTGGKCAGIYSVEDEMGKRFRTGCIKRDGACIKGDIAVPKGSKQLCDGVYEVEKI